VAAPPVAARVTLNEVEPVLNDEYVIYSHTPDTPDAVTLIVPPAGLKPAVLTTLIEDAPVPMLEVIVVIGKMPACS
jgi:hypothetical protein